MNKIRCAILTLSLGALAGTPLAFSGAGSSGGGAAAVCRDQHHTVISAQILDLYEGRVRYGYLIPDRAGSPESQLAGAITNLTDFDYYKPLLRQVAAQVIRSMQFLPEGVTLAVPPDLGGEFGVVVPEGCALEAAGFYETDGTLKISRSVYRAMSSTDRAAFVLHEAIYKIARDLGRATDSSGSRRLNAGLFAVNVPSSVIIAETPIVFDGADYSWLHQARKDNIIFVPGPGPYAPLTVRISPESDALYRLEMSCDSMGLYNSNLPAVFTGSGVYETSYGNTDCFTIDTRIWGVNPGPYAKPIGFSIQVMYKGNTLFERHASIAGNQPSDSYPLGPNILHPEEEIPQFPRLP